MSSDVSADVRVDLVVVDRERIDFLGQRRSWLHKTYADGHEDFYELGAGADEGYDPFTVPRRTISLPEWMSASVHNEVHKVGEMSDRG